MDDHDNDSLDTRYIVVQEVVGPFSQEEAQESVVVGRLGQVGRQVAEELAEEQELVPGVEAEIVGLPYSNML